MSTTLKTLRCVRRYPALDIDDYQTGRDIEVTAIPAHTQNFALTEIVVTAFPRAGAQERKIVSAE